MIPVPAKRDPNMVTFHELSQCDHDLVYMGDNSHATIRCRRCKLEARPADNHYLAWVRILDAKLDASRRAGREAERAVDPAGPDSFGGSDFPLCSHCSDRGCDRCNR